MLAHPKCCDKEGPAAYLPPKAFSTPRSGSSVLVQFIFTELCFNSPFVITCIARAGNLARR